MVNYEKAAERLIEKVDRLTEQLADKNKVITDLVGAIRAYTSFMDTQKPRKLDDALTWVGNEVLVKEKLKSALDAAERK